MRFRNLDMAAGRSVRWYPRVAIWISAAAILAIVGVTGKASANSTDLPEWRALVVGIDAYETLPKLQGAVNDARDIAQTLNRAGVSDVTLLLDGKAGRDDILAAWTNLVERARPNDRLLFSFAGHGAQEREWLEGSEADGFDEVFMLSGFGPDAPKNGERLRDDDIAAMLRRAGDRQVLVLADSCHSGTLTRAVDGRVKRLGTRLVSLPEIRNDVLRSNDTRTEPDIVAGNSGNDPEHQAGVLYLGAARDGMVIPEVYFGETPRGALSWSFARALEGRADLDRDGNVSAEELTSFLTETVRISTEGRQIPEFSIGRTAKSLSLPQADDTSFSSGQKLLRLGATTAEGKGGLARAAARHETMLLAGEADQADLIWDPGSGDILSRHGDVVAAGAARAGADVLPVAAKWLFLAKLKQLAVERAQVNLQMRPAVGHVAAGSDVNLQLTSTASGNALVFALEADGRVRLLAPHPKWDRGALEVGPETPYGLELQAAAPFGVDHLVMIHGRQSLAPITGLFSALDGKPLDLGMIDGVVSALAAHTQGIGIAPVYTRQR